MNEIAKRLRRLENARVDYFGTSRIDNFGGNCQGWARIFCSCKLKKEITFQTNSIEVAKRRVLTFFEKNKVTKCAPILILNLKRRAAIESSPTGSGCK